MARPPVFELVLASMLLLPSYARAADIGKPPIWGYNGAHNNAEEWGTLSPDYASCSVGNSQSPVGLDFTTSAELPKLEPDYRTAKTQVTFEDRTIVMRVQHGNRLTIGKGTYTLKEIRFHTPAEHSVKNKLYPLEIQMMHQDKKGKWLILAIFASFGKTNMSLDPILAQAPAARGITHEMMFSPVMLLPSKLNYYAYRGSLTYPPCTEGVEWRVLTRAITLSKEQLAKFASILGRNARQLQPLYLRTIQQSGE